MNENIQAAIRLFDFQRGAAALWVIEEGIRHPSLQRLRLALLCHLSRN